MTSRIYLFWFGVLAFRLIFASHAWSDSARIAVASDPALADLVDTVTAELWTNANHTMLDRADLDKLGQEQALQSVIGERDFSPVRVIPADGLVLLRSAGEAGVFARLVAVQPGVVLREIALPARLKPSDRARTIADEFAPYWAKLVGLQKGSVAALSLLGLRFEVDSPERRQLERQFNILLGSQLSAEPDCVVLERWRLNDPLFEKSLQAQPTAGFWMGGEIAASNDYSPLVEGIWYLGDVPQLDQTAALPLVHAVLDAPQPGRSGLIVLENLWHPADTAPADAAQIWKEEQGYVKRRTDLVMQKEGRPDASFLAEMDSVMYYFKGKYPEVTRAPLEEEASATAALSVTRFWYPWKATDVPITSGVIIGSAIAGDDDTLWLSAYVSQLEKSRIFKVHLPDFSTRTIEINGTSTESLIWTPEALYLPFYSKETTNGFYHLLSRYDFASATWETRTLPVSFEPQHIAFVNGCIYVETSAGGPAFGDREVGLAKYDWATDKLNILAGSRRRPAQNQFDDTAPYRISAIFTGPGGRPAVTTDTGTYYIEEAPGTWPTVFDGRFSDSVATEDGCGLILNGQGEATYIDPKVAAPIPWMAADAPLFRRAKGLPGVTGPVLTPWAKDTIWDCPPGKQKWMYPGSVAFRGGRLFILNQPNPTEDRFEFLCYDRAFGRKPVHIPLSFQLGAADKPELEKHPGDLPNGFRLDQLEHPHSPFIPRITGTSQGLCLTIQEAGFWFIPFADIGTYLKTKK